MTLIPKNPKYRERIEEMLTRQNFMHEMKFNLSRIEAGTTEGLLEVLPMHLQQDGFLHGGVIATLADIVAGFSAFTLVAAEQKVVTGEIKVSFFSKGEGKKIKAVGRVIKPGKKINFCEAEIYSIENDGERLIAKATTSMITI